MNFIKEYIKAPMSFKVTLTDDAKTLIFNFVDEVIASKQNEAHHKVDNGRERLRWFTGFTGEWAIEQLLGESFMDLSVGNSNDYHVSDLSELGLDIGVKTVEYGKFPIIFKNNTTPQIIVVKESNNLIVCGLASPSVLNQYQSDDLILSPKLKARGTKTGFYGFEHLKSFNSVSDLKLLTSKLPNGTKFVKDNKTYTVEVIAGQYRLTSGDNVQNNLDITDFNIKLKKLLSEGKIKFIKNE